MTKDKASRSLPLTIALQIPTDWTPEQAFAVFAMIDDLREAIWRCYSLQIQDQYRDQCVPIASGVNRDRSDPPF
jgi:hypothetical protein